MITIKKVTAEEALLVATIGAKTLIESHGHSAPPPDIENYVSKNYDLKKVTEELNNPENIFHIIYVNDQAAGYSKIILNNPHPLIASPAVTKLERLYLLREFYNLKLGRKLFEYIVAISKSAKQDGIWLQVWTQNQRALTFYEKSGFRIIGNTEFKISETHSNPNYLMYLQYQENT